MAIVYGMADSEKRYLALYPKTVKKIEDIDRLAIGIQEELKAEPRGLVARLRRWRLKRRYKRLEENQDDPFHAGAMGEIRVKETLSRLGDEYHVLCGVGIRLPYFISYDGKKDLKSAQIDFVVVSKKGVYAIEVKNWSNGFIDQRSYFSPHEQAGRAGRLLWHVLKSWRRTPRVTSVVLSIRGNIRYDPKYRAVFTASADNINDFLERRGEVLSDGDVEKIVSKLKDHVAK